ncbi:MAG: tetratricopeptide repeat protein [Bryobacteraceae bacterium]|nr:tetratricopeptide repeat protein [Bryobacteraceae bacterium]
MKRTAWLVLLAAPLAAQKRDQMLEMQRDIGLLQDQLKTIEKTQNDRFAAIEKLLAQAINNQVGITGSLAKLDQAMAAQQKALNAPVATLGSKVDEMSSEFGGVRTTVAEISAQMRKMQAQMTDLSNAIKVLQAPPAAPSLDPNSPPPGMTSDAVYQEAMRAKAAGQFDLAAQRYNEFLRFYGTTELAPNAQFYLGEIAYNREQFEDAVAAFDAVVEKYPENNKTFDAMYMKGLALIKIDKRDAAGAEFRALIRRAPSSEQAAKARDQLKRLTPATPARKKK